MNRNSRKERTTVDVWKYEITDKAKGQPGIPCSGRKGDRPGCAVNEGTGAGYRRGGCPRVLRNRREVESLRLSPGNPGMFKGYFMGKAFMHSTIDNRSVGDLYETPYSMTAQLFENEFFDHRGSVLEPAAGNGAMVAILQNYFRDLTHYDIETDFLTESRQFDYVITNPPYRLADEFVEKAREVTRHKFAFLLRINFLSGENRLQENRFRELKRIYVFFPDAGPQSANSR